MEFSEACGTLNDWIARSNGHPITLSSGREYTFVRRRQYTETEIARFEVLSGVVLPHDYRWFLQHVGVVDCFRHRYGAIQFLELETMQSEMDQVFDGLVNPYPTLLLTIMLIGRGEWAGFDHNRAPESSFTVFIPDIYPEDWALEASGWGAFSVWLIQLVQSEGTDLHSW